MGSKRVKQMQNSEELRYLYIEKGKDSEKLGKAEIRNM
jgi:hypothetical protein